MNALIEIALTAVLAVIVLVLITVFLVMTVYDRKCAEVHSIVVDNAVYRRVKDID